LNIPNVDFCPIPLLISPVTIYALIIISDLKRIRKKEALSASKEAIHPPLREVPFRVKYSAFDLTFSMIKSTKTVRAD